ncbi:PCI domain-containing protein [Pseudozyma hubeiensis]|nr:PCI domain-containing protein [Pseudozyma hubeiensis]
MRGEVMSAPQASASVEPSRSEVEAEARSSAWAEPPQSGAMANVGPWSRISAMQKHHNPTTSPHNGRAGKSVSFGVAGKSALHSSVRRVPKTDSRRLVQTANAAVDPASKLWSTPLQRSERSKSRPLKPASPHHSGADRPKAKLSLDLSSLSHFSLPQAIPLQPRPRYPISMVETASLYETDQDTDRESDTSPSGGTPFCMTPDPAFPVSGIAKRKSFDRAQRNDHLSSANELSSVAVSFDPQGRGSSSTSERRDILSSSSGASDGPFKKVPLSNVVRSRTWSNASQTSSSTQVVPPGSVDPANAIRTDHPKLSQSKIAEDRAAGSSFRSGIPSLERSGSTGAPSKRDARAFATFVSNGNRSASYDFTRQALLDLIRRTNLGMAQNTPTDSTAAGSSPCRPPSSSKECSSVAGKPAIAGPDVSVSCPSNVPADLQARLQSWQHHRKRQKLPNEVSNDLSRDTAASQCSTDSDPSEPLKSSRHALLAELRVGEQSWSNKVSSAEEQEQKSRKHEHYQRLLNELDAQMQTMRRTEAQKQKDKEAADDPPRVHTSENGSKKEAEFRKPSPPSKISAGSSSRTLGCNATASVSNDEGRVQLSLQSSQGDIARAGGPTQVTLSLSKDQNPTVNSYAATQGTGTDSLTTANASGPGTYSANSGTPAVSAATWTVGAGSSSSGLQSLPAGSGWLPTSSYGYANWQQNSVPLQPTFKQGSHQNAIMLSTDWQSCQRAMSQPSWLSSSAGGSSNQTASHLSMTSAGWTQTTNRGVANTSNSSLAVGMMLRHPNWSRDLLPGTWNHINTMHAPHYVDTSSFAISTAAGNSGGTSVMPRQASDQTAHTVAATGSSTIKRPFSPGAEVAFWSVKGEHSVKLRGTVESMTDRSASIVVVPADDANPMGSGTNGTENQTSNQAQAGQMTYSNVPFVNIVARDQALILGLL